MTEKNIVLQICSSCVSFANVYGDQEYQESFGSMSKRFMSKWSEDMSEKRKQTRKINIRVDLV